MRKLNGWQRIGVIISASWLIYAATLMVSSIHDSYEDIEPVGSLLREEPPFRDYREDNSNRDLPDLENKHWVWVDSISGKVIKRQEIIYGKPGHSTFDEPTLDNLFPEDKVEATINLSPEGEIEPALKLKSGVLLKSLVVFLLPLFFFWSLSYGVVWMAKWVVAGFK